MSEITASYSSKLEKYNNLGIENLYYELAESFIKYNSLIHNKSQQLQENYAPLPASPADLKVLDLEETNSLPVGKTHRLVVSQNESIGDELLIEASDRFSEPELLNDSEPVSEDNKPHYLVINEEYYNLLDELNGFQIRVLMTIFKAIPNALANHEICEELNIDNNPRERTKTSRTLNKLEQLGLIIQKDRVQDAREKSNCLLEKGFNLLYSLYSLLDYHFYDFYTYADNKLKNETLKKLYASLLIISKLAEGKDWVEVNLSKISKLGKEALKNSYLILSTSRSIILLEMIEDESIWLRLGKVAHKLSWYEKAEAFYKTYIEYAPSDAEALTYLGLSLYHQNKYDEIINLL